MYIAGGMSSLSSHWAPVIYTANLVKTHSHNDVLVYRKAIQYLRIVHFTTDVFKLCSHILTLLYGSIEVRSNKSRYASMYILPRSPSVTQFMTSHN